MYVFYTPGNFTSKWKVILIRVHRAVLTHHYSIYLNDFFFPTVWSAQATSEACFYRLQLLGVS